MSVDFFFFSKIWYEPQLPECSHKLTIWTNLEPWLQATLSDNQPTDLERKAKLNVMCTSGFIPGTLPTDVLRYGNKTFIAHLLVSFLSKSYFCKATLGAYGSTLALGLSEWCLVVDAVLGFSVLTGLKLFFNDSYKLSALDLFPSVSSCINFRFDERFWLPLCTQSNPVGFAENPKLKFPQNFECCH